MRNALAFCAPLNNQDIDLAEKNFPHIRITLLEDSNPSYEKLPTDILNWGGLFQVNY